MLPGFFVVVVVWRAEHSTYDSDPPIAHKVAFQVCHEEYVHAGIELGRKSPMHHCQNPERRYEADEYNHVDIYQDDRRMIDEGFAHSRCS